MADLGIRYATALFEISQEDNQLSDFLEQAQFLLTTLRDNEAMRILSHPRISADEKFAFVEKTYAGSVHKDLLGFMRLAINKNREDYLLPALAKLVEMIRYHQNQTTARIVSAIPLSLEQANKLAETLARKLNKQVDLSIVVDPDAIAGISIQVDGFYLDRTVKTLLKDMKENIRRGAGQ